MLAREYCDAAKIKHKPIILSHHMLYGLKAGQEKMSKSDPESAVFMEDSSDDVERKIMNAFCPSTSEAAVSNVSVDEEEAGKESMHLKDDGLKNPCLDYIENIIFSPPNATFTAGSTTFNDYPAVQEAFLSKTISENELKRGLIDELNRLLEPVRSHFLDDDNARHLLELVNQYKKETVASHTDNAIRRLNLVEHKTVAGGAHLVFAPLPSGEPTLQSVIDTLTCLAQVGSDVPLVLFLSDWTARVCNACNADMKVIACFYSIYVSSLNAINPTLMANVQVVLQSEAILLDPSNYWISVINVGRHFMLDEVMGTSMSGSDCVGKVIGRLMKVADVAGVGPATIALQLTDEATAEKTLVVEFIAKKLTTIAVPHVELIRTTSIRLQPERESEALKTESDEYFLLDDPKVRLNPRAYACESFLL
jgi:tyrosyl-tRNA synthetase